MPERSDFWSRRRRAVAREAARDAQAVETEQAAEADAAAARAERDRAVRPPTLARVQS